MLERIKWIAVSYFTRASVVVLLALAAMTSIVPYIPRAGIVVSPGLMTVPAYPRVPRDNLSIVMTADLSDVRLLGKQDQVRYIDLENLWMNVARERSPDGGRYPPGPEFFQLLDEFPNVRAIRIRPFNLVEPFGLEELARLKHLEHLQLDQFSSSDISWLAKLKSLRQLNLVLTEPARGIDQLRELPNLTTVVFELSNGVDAKVLGELAQLPHLQTLAIVLPNGPNSRAAFPLGDLSHLAASESLEKLYVGGPGQADIREMIAAVGAELPKVDVASAFARSMFNPVLPLRLAPVLLLALAIGAQLSSQFRGPNSRLAPNYVAAHAVFAGVLGLAATFFVTWRLVGWGANPLPASGLCLAVLTTVVASASLSALFGGRQPEGIRWSLSSVSPFLTFGMAGLLFFGNPDGAWLTQRVPWVILGLFAVSAIGLANAMWVLANVVELSADVRGGGGWEGAWRQSVASARYDSAWQFASDSQERRIDALKARQDESWWQRIERWRAGSAPVRFGYFLIVAVAFGGPMWLFRQQPAQIAQLANRSAPIASAVLVVMVWSFQIGTMWRARLLALPLEMMRPMHRTTLQREMMAALAVDMIRPAAVAALLSAIGMNVDHAWNISWGGFAISLPIVFVVAWCATIAAGSLMIVVQRVWLAYLCEFGLLYLLLGSVFLLSVWSLHRAGLTHRALTPQDFQAQLWAPLVVSLAIAWWMAKRWTTMEIDPKVG